MLTYAFLPVAHSMDLQNQDDDFRCYRDKHSIFDCSEILLEFRNVRLPYGSLYSFIRKNC